MDGEYFFDLKHNRMKKLMVLMAVGMMCLAACGQSPKGNKGNSRHEGGMGMDKEAAFLYLFVGWWPAAKAPLEARVRGKIPRLALKTVLFVACVGLMYSLLIFLLHMDAIAADFGEMGRWMTALFFAALVVCLLLFDRLLTPLGVIWQRRLRPKLRFLRR